MRVIAALAVGVAGVGIGLAAWNRFTASSKPIPIDHKPGFIFIFVPRDATNIDLRYTLAPFSVENSDAIAFPRDRRELDDAELSLSFEVSNNKRDCREIEARVASPSAEVSEESSNKILKRGADGFFTFAACQEQVLKNVGGEWKHFVYYSSDLKIKSLRQVEVKGYRISARLPTIMVNSNFISSIPIRSDWKATFSMGIYDVPSQIRVDTANPPPNQQRGISWREGGYRVSSGDQSITLTYLPGEAAANRNLFIAGVFAGVAAALIPWSLQMFFDHLPPGRERECS